MASGIAGSDAVRSLAIRRSSHASGLHSVERQLASLHSEMLHLGREDARAVRLSVLTLVAVCPGAEQASVAEDTVALLAQTHPARAIIVVAEPGGDSLIEADLALICSPAGEGQVCAEQVRLTLRGRAAHHLPSAVTPLLASDVPVYEWLVGGGRSLLPGYTRDASALRARLIVDSDAYDDAPETLRTVAAEVEHHPELNTADLAWARGRPWREHLAQTFDGPNLRPFASRISRVEVECSGAAPSASGWLIAGWLRSRMERATGSAPEVSVTASAGSLPSGELVAVRIFASTKAHRAVVTATRPDANIHVRVHLDGAPAGSTVVPMASPDTRRLVGSLLEDLPADPAHLAALQSAAALAAQGGSAAEPALSG